MKKKSSVFGTLFFAAILLAMAIVSNKYMIKPLAEEVKASVDWPATPGLITHSEMNREWKKDEQNLNEGDYMYSAEVRYNYSVGGKQYEGTRIEATQSSTSSESSVEETLQEYAMGNTVSVYYNPESPNKAMLITGASFGLKLLFKLPYVFGVFGVLMILGLLKRLLFRR